MRVRGKVVRVLNSGEGYITISLETRPCGPFPAEPLRSSNKLHMRGYAEAKRLFDEKWNAATHKATLVGKTIDFDLEEP